MRAVPRVGVCRKLNQQICYLCYLFSKVYVCRQCSVKYCTSLLVTVVSAHSIAQQSVVCIVQCTDNITLNIHTWICVSCNMNCRQGNGASVVSDTFIEWK